MVVPEIFSHDGYSHEPDESVNSFGEPPFEDVLEGWRVVGGEAENEDFLAFGDGRAHNLHQLLVVHVASDHVLVLRLQRLQRRQEAVPLV